MPYKFKDDGSHIIKPFQKKIYLIIGSLIVGRAFLDLFLVGGIDVMDILNIILGLFMIWGIQFNGFYKIARRYAEWKLKQQDNKWR